MSLERRVADLTAQLAALQTESAVRQVAMRYFRLCDTLGPDTALGELGACFTQQAIWEGRGLYQAAFGVHRGREAIVAMLTCYATPQPHFAMNAHFLASELIEIEGDGAIGRWTMLQTSTYRDGGADLRSAALTIRFAFEEGAWRMSHFVTDAIFSRAVDHWSDASPISVPPLSPQEPS